MNLFCWNCRGGSNPQTVRILQHWRRVLKPDIMFISETMCSGKAIEDLKWKLGFPSAIGVDAIGLSGGLCIFWSNNVRFVLESFSSRHIIGSVHSEDGLVWRFGGIYGWAKASEKKYTWSLLRELCNNNAPTIIGGDFNATLDTQEKVGGTEHSDGSRFDFRHTLVDCGLHDLGTDGVFYTWERGKDQLNRIRERLDRFVANDPWSNMHPQARVTGLTRIGSDHSPILLRTKGHTYYTHTKRRPFRIEPHWIRNKNSGDAIANHWKSLKLGSLPYKLMDTARFLRQWGDSGDLKFKVASLEKKLKEAQNRDTTDWNVIECLHLEKDLKNLLRDQEIYWQTRAKGQEIREGDRNSRYFH